MLSGKVSVLTAVERGDLKQLLDWRNNPEFRKHFREYRELNMDQQTQWFEQKVNGDPATVMFSIRDKETMKLVGCCGFELGT